VDGDRLREQDEVRRDRVMQLTAEHRQALYAAAMRYCRSDRATADDLVQDTCARAWLHIESLHDESRLFSWLLRILHNVWIDVCRKQLPVILVADVPDQVAPVEELSPWQRVTADDFREAIEQLAEPYRSAAIMQYIDNLSNADIAKQLAIPYATAATRLHRARKQLRELLSARLRSDEVG
jgi:RNA polymerase sigma-70 factor, ECF subfamily